ncbi:hypothetical protein JOB18_000541 [Solea senegalensis]|nr:hypothetical protein JOB18_000541 [Solea senegalensis]
MDDCIPAEKIATPNQQQFQLNPSPEKTHNIQPSPARLDLTVPTDSMKLKIVGGGWASQMDGGRSHWVN